MAIRSITSTEYMVRNRGPYDLQNLYINQKPTIRFGERFWHADKYLFVECDHRHEGVTRSIGDWKPFPALCVFRVEGGTSVHVGYLPLHVVYAFVEVRGSRLVIGNRNTSSTTVSWYELDFTALDAVWVRKRFVGGAASAVPRLSDVPSNFLRPLGSVNVPGNPLPRGDGFIAAGKLFDSRLVMWSDDGKVFTQGQEGSVVGPLQPLTLPPGAPGSLGRLAHSDGPYLFISGSVRTQNDTVYQFYFSSVDSAGEFLFAIDAPSLSLHTSGKSLFCVSAQKVSIFDVDLMDHIDDVSLPWSLYGSNSAMLDRGNLAYAFGPSRSFPSGGLGVFDILGGRSVSAHKFSERSFSERRGRSTHKGIVCDFADGPGYAGPWLTAAENAPNKFFSSVALSNFRRSEWPRSRYMYWPIVVEFEFDV